MLGFLKSLFAKPASEQAEPPKSTGFKRLPAPPDALSYRAQLSEILMAHSPHAIDQIKDALENLAPKTEDLSIGIHPDQDGEGTFSVMLHPGGPDLYVLGKAIQDYRLLFAIKRVPGGLNVEVPLFDPGEASYEVRDVLADAAADWVEAVWAIAGVSRPDLPVMVFCDDDWGHTTPRWLQNRPS